MRRTLAVLAFLLAACSRKAPPAPSFVLATTTTIPDSGLLPVLVVGFKLDTNIDIRPVVVSSAQALRLAEEHRADATITSNAAAERRFVDHNGARIYQPLMWSDFVITGPASDPADVAHARSAADAFRRIHNAHAIFFSRGDQSGTNTKERALWQAALVVPDFNPGYVKMDQPMPDLLRSSSNLKAYTLSDRATFDQLEGELQTRVLFSGDPFLRSTHAVTLMRSSGRPEAANAARFVTWLLHGRGHSLLETYAIKGKRAFHMM